MFLITLAEKGGGSQQLTFKKGEVHHRAARRQ